VSEPKSHHYVPRFYLERFVDAQGALWVYDKSQDRIFSTGPAGVAAENRFYEVPELAEIGKSPMLLEHQFADLESEVCNITNCWFRQLELGDKVEIPNINREFVSLYLSLQLLRTAEARAQIVQFNEAFHVLKGQTSAVPPSDPRDLHTQLIWYDELVFEIRDRIKECSWLFAKNESSQPFYTSDHPVLIKASDSKHWIQGPKVFERGMYLVFPLSPIWMLYCHATEDKYEPLKKFDGRISPVKFDEDMVNHENSGQVGMSNRFVFSVSSDFTFAKEFCELEKGIKDPNRPRYEIDPQKLTH